MNFKLKSAELYLSSSCNLKCSYCYISKNPGFYELDKMVQKNLSNNIYLKNLKKAFPDKYALEELILWGGEPSLGFEPFGNHLYSILDEFPNITKFMTSTNFCTDIKNFTDLFDKINDYGRPVEFKIQISLDGPIYINDTNRGLGTTEAILENLRSLTEYANEKQWENLNLSMSFKPTISIENIKHFLSGTQEENFKRVVGYHKFFESIFEEFENTNQNSKIELNSKPAMTYVMPGQYTSEDGKLFTEFLKLMHEIEKEHDQHPIFKFTNRIDATRNRMLKGYEAFVRGSTCGYCSIFKSRMAILPTEEGLMAGCHRSFSDYFESYLKGREDLNERNVISVSEGLTNAVKDNFFYSITQSDMLKMQEKMRQIYSAIELPIVAIASLIYELALIGQTDPVYLDDNDKLVRAAYIIRNNTPCLYDHMATTGTFMTMDPSVIRLYCNGAIEYILESEGL